MIKWNKRKATKFDPEKYPTEFLGPNMALFPQNKEDGRSYVKRVIRHMRRHLTEEQFKSWMFSYILKDVPIDHAESLYKHALTLY